MGMGKVRKRKAMVVLLALLGIVPLLAGCARIEATIRSYSPNDPENPAQVEPGDTVTLSVTVANTGNRARAFIVRAAIWSKGGPLEKRYETVLDPPLKPGEERTVSWTHTVNREGEYSVQFSVWKDEDTPLAQAPQTAQRLIVVAGEPAPPTPRKGLRYKLVDASRRLTAKPNRLAILERQRGAVGRGGESDAVRD